MASKAPSPFADYPNVSPLKLTEDDILAELEGVQDYLAMLGSDEEGNDRTNIWLVESKGNFYITYVDPTPLAQGDEILADNWWIYERDSKDALREKAWDILNFIQCYQQLMAEKGATA